MQEIEGTIFNFLKSCLQNQTAAKQTKSTTTKPKQNKTKKYCNQHHTQRWKTLILWPLRLRKRQTSVHFYHIFTFIQHGAGSKQCYEACREDRFRFEGKKYKSPYAQMT